MGEKSARRWLYNVSGRGIPNERGTTEEMSSHFKEDCYLFSDIGLWKRKSIWYP